MLVLRLSALTRGFCFSWWSSCVQITIHTTHAYGWYRQCILQFAFCATSQQGIYQKWSCLYLNCPHYRNPKEDSKNNTRIKGICLAYDELYLLLDRKLSYPWSLALNFRQDCFSSRDSISLDWHQQHRHDWWKRRKFQLEGFSTLNSKQLTLVSEKGVNHFSFTEIESTVFLKTWGGPN